MSFVATGTVTQAVGARSDHLARAWSVSCSVANYCFLKDGVTIEAGHHAGGRKVPISQQVGKRKLSKGVLKDGCCCSALGFFLVEWGKECPLGPGLHFSVGEGRG
jgi:hypothetical protein